MVPLHTSVLPSDHLSVRNTFGVPSLCNLLLQIFLFLSIQTYHNDCSHIEDVHLLFCAHFMNISSFLRGIKVRHFSVQKCLDGVWFV